ncbi:hypothetical protein AX16_006498 [Volvariella volvacea WC 439]|nr:hypothetical protein AX16_006498 [Volvariella volvacea WC 439]
MIVERASYHWAYSEDIPGSRCGPEDGPWPRPYQVLQEHEIWRELGFLAKPQSTSLVSGDANLDSTTTPNAQTDNATEGEARTTQPGEKQRVFRADSINFQPSPNTKTQDRYVVTQLEVNGKMWTLTGVFDGHLGDVTVEHVAHHLPIIIRDALNNAVEALTATAANATNPAPALARFVTAPSSTSTESFTNSATSSYLSGPSPSPSSSSASISPANLPIPATAAADPSSLPSNPFSPAFISNLLKKAILNFDEAIANDVLSLFGGIEGLKDFTDAEIRSVINDQHRGGDNWKKARLCMYGTTALVALVDPDYENLWVANLGDCQAILVSPREQPAQDGTTAATPLMDDWNIEVLTTTHNGDNDAEIERVQRLHPGEPECVVDRRVLGALAPFRCLGDVPFKQPPEFTRRILYNLLPGFHNTSPWEEFLVRNRTAPYISAEAEVIHRKLSDSQPGAQGEKEKEDQKNRFLILCSDGFTDLCSEGQKRIIESWARGLEGSGCFDDGNNASSSMSVSPPSPPSKRFSFFGGGGFSPTRPGFGGIKANVKANNNLALRLLRRALGGEDRESVSRVLTLDMDQAWIDDTSIVVQML